MSAELLRYWTLTGWRSALLEHIASLTSRESTAQRGLGLVGQSDDSKETARRKISLANLY